MILFLLASIVIGVGGDMRSAVLALVLLASPAYAQFASEQDRREAVQHYRDGQEFMSAEQFERAAEAYQKAIDKDRLLTLAHYGLGQANMSLRRFASAIQAFTNCREAYRTLHGLAERDRVAVERQRDEEIRELKDTARRLQGMNTNRTYELRVTKVEARIEELERQRTSTQVVFTAPAEVSLALGSAYFRNNQLPEAEREWKAAVDANPKLGEAHNNLAALYAMTGRKAEAESAVKAAEKAGFRVNPKLKDDIKRIGTGNSELGTRNFEPQFQVPRSPFQVTRSAARLLAPAATPAWRGSSRRTRR
jgi:tetratricopeptide (TPR) repeat protein